MWIFEITPDKELLVEFAPNLAYISSKSNIIRQNYAFLSIAWRGWNRKI